MNAQQVLLDLNSKIKAELLYLYNSIHIRDVTVTGHIYTNSNKGENLSLEQYEGRVNDELIRNCKLYLGYGLVSRFEYELTNELIGTAKEKFLGALNTHSFGAQLTANQFLLNLEEILEFDDFYFERLLAHTLMFEKSLKYSSKLTTEAKSELAKQVKFNNFSISKLCTIEDGCFFKNPSAILSVIVLINNICGRSFSDSNIKSALNTIEYLDAFDANHSIKEIEGIKITAQKNGNLKFTLDKSKAELLEAKVQPHLVNFNRLMVDTSQVEPA